MKDDFKDILYRAMSEFFDDVDETNYLRASLYLLIAIVIAIGCILGIAFVNLNM
jgi:hypothetical protein